MGMIRTVRVTEEEFLALPESMDKIELIDGEVILAPPPSWAHQVIVSRVNFALTLWARGQPQRITVGFAPADFRFGRGRILQPDVFVIFGDIDFDHVGPVDRIPELCVEVLSTDRVYDRVTKRLLYANVGMKEYWIVDPAGVVERWTGHGLAEGGDVSGVLRSPLLPGFELELVKLFQGGTIPGV